METGMHGHAIVIGGSMAGLLAAFGAAESFEQVTIVERDELLDGADPRRGVPQGRQVHVCLPIGLTRMTEFIPDLREQLIAAGCSTIDQTRDAPFITSEGWRMRVSGPFESIGFRRPLFEWVIRRNLLKLPNVELRVGAVVGLLASGDTVTGVRLEGGEVIRGDLVIDASGRGSKSPKWMQELGYDPPAEVHIRAFIGYASQLVRLPEGALPDEARGLIAIPFPGHPTGGVLLPADNGMHALAGMGMMKAYPPANREALLDYLDLAPTPLLGQIARQSEPVSEVTAYRIPSNQRRLWERLERRPDGFVVTGDAVASYDPIYGQGMSQAAHGGVVMRDVLRNESRDPRPLPVRFQEGLATFTDVAFTLSGMLDASYEGAQVEGMDPPDLSQMEYFKVLEQLATEDCDAVLALNLGVYSMELERLLTDEIQAKVQAWKESGRSVSNNDPTRIPGVTSTVGV
jgi:2-polyprenyl-6-methoxyphenol hydroxylase-like FAD-dependent oxidoreductase